MCNKTSLHERSKFKPVLTPGDEDEGRAISRQAQAEASWLKMSSNEMPKGSTYTQEVKRES